jgi:hypothetical protein
MPPMNEMGAPRPRLTSPNLGPRIRRDVTTLRAVDNAFGVTSSHIA